MEESKEALTKRLAENQKRLDELGADKKSARKRILGQISKIKAQLDGRRPKEGNGETKKRKIRVDEVRVYVCVCVCQYPCRGERDGGRDGWPRREMLTNPPSHSLSLTHTHTQPAAEHHGIVGGISKKVKREQLREKKKKESEAKGKEKAAVSDRKKAKLRWEKGRRRHDHLHPLYSFFTHSTGQNMTRPSS